MSYARSRRYSVATIEPAPYASAGSDKDPAVPAPDAPGAGAAESAVAHELTVALVQQKIMSLKWLRRSFVQRGLAFMIDHPIAAIRAAAGRILDHAGGRASWVIALIVLLVVFVLRSIWPTGFMVSTWHWVLSAFQWFALGSAASLAVVLLVLIVSGAPSTVLEWSKVGNSMAVMLGFVLLAFFTADSWRAAGAIPWCG
jgi:hypothetical protein